MRRQVQARAGGGRRGQADTFCVNRRCGDGAGGQRQRLAVGVGVVQGEQAEAGQEVLVHRDGESLLQKKARNFWLRAGATYCVMQ